MGSDWTEPRLTPRKKGIARLSQTGGRQNIGEKGGGRGGG